MPVIVIYSTLTQNWSLHVIRNDAYKFTQNNITIGAEQINFPNSSYTKAFIVIKQNQK